MPLGIYKRTLEHMKQIQEMGFRNKGRIPWNKYKEESERKKAQKKSARKSYLKSREKYIARAKKWRETNFEKMQKYMKNYREKNKLRAREYSRKWAINHRKEHRTEINTYDRKWKRKKRKKDKIEINKQCRERRHKLGINKRYNSMYSISRFSKTKAYRRLQRQKRKALMKGGGKLTIKTIQLVYEDNIKRYGTLTCYLCLEPIEFGKDTLEHKTPLSRGGTNEYNNLGIACQKCNFSKSNKTEEEYRRIIFMAMKAIEKFVNAMNQSSFHWKKSIEVTAREGKIEAVHCGGFTWTSDKEEDKIKEVDRT